MRKPLKESVRDRQKRTDIEQGLAAGAAGEEEIRPEAEAPLLSPAEAARYLGVARKALYRLVENGLLVPVGSGRAMRFDMRTLEDFKARGGST